MGEWRWSKHEFQNSLFSIKVLILGFTDSNLETSDSNSSNDDSKRAKNKHFMAFAVNVFFSVILSTFDIGSDFVTGIDFIQRGDLNWGTFTLVIIFVPWFARLLLSIFDLPRCLKKNSWRKFDPEKIYVWKLEMRNSLWEFPLFQPFRCVLLFAIPWKSVYRYSLFNLS